MMASPLARILQTGVRRYASAASASPLEAPIRLHGVAGRYALAMYNAAIKQGKLDKVESEFKLARQMVEENEPFRRFIKSEALMRYEKKEGVAAVLAKGGFDPLVIDFFKILAENNRLGDTPEIVDRYEDMMRAQRKEVVAQVYSAQELSATESQKINHILEGLLKEGEQLVVHAKVDPSLIGGLKVEFGDKLIDLSVATKIQKLTALLRQPI